MHIEFVSWRQRAWQAGWVLSFIWFLGLPAVARGGAETLLIFAGAASKPPTAEVAKLFEQKYGVSVQIIFGGSGFVLSQMKLARKGDIYFPGSSDFMEKAKGEGLVLPGSERLVTYLVPAINVQKGNPCRIRALPDLLKSGLRLGIGDPESVCVGTYAVEVVEKNFALRERGLFRKNLATTVESCERTANILSLKVVDAVIGWEVFGRWDPERIETIYLKPEQVPRIGYIPAAVSRFSLKPDLSDRFLRFLISPEAQNVFKRHGYMMKEEEARRHALAGTPVGGEYSLPEAWRRKGMGMEKTGR
jgi:molybdate transport system substrate-binding protein